MKFRWMTLLVLLAITVLSGCAGTQAAPPPVKTGRVEMPPSYRFSPEVIEVSVGTTVTWHNGDNFTHSVVFVDGNLPQLILQPGESGSITFNKPGEYDYECSFHPGDMTGKVIVTAP